jgi:predicted ATP-grasp superfamily ATP-dependent carboligase
LEYITAGGLSREPLSTALLQEGAMMRDALLRDFADIAKVEVMTTYDIRLPKPENVAQAIPVDAETDAETIWHDLLGGCDAALIVAPETGGILAKLTAMIEDAHKQNLGSHLAAVQITSDKYTTYEVLMQTDIETIPTYQAQDIAALQDFADLQYLVDLKDSVHGYMLKPRDGAGCEQTYFFRTKAGLTEMLANHSAENFIVQPYQPGKAASISALFKAGQAWVLSCDEQLINISEQQVTLKGCTVNALAEYRQSFHHLANQISQAIPSLNGYVGIDVIIADNAIFVVEINPRITTSYIGLRESLNYNPASLILDIVTKPVFEMRAILNNTVEILLHA